MSKNWRFYRNIDMQAYDAGYTLIIILKTKPVNFLVAWKLQMKRMLDNSEKEQARQQVGWKIFWE